MFSREDIFAWTVYSRKFLPAKISQIHFSRKCPPAKITCYTVCRWYMALVGCLKDDYSLSQYFLQIDSLNCQFKSSFLELNIAQTKELVFGKGKAGNTPTPICIDNQGDDIVSIFKYLGTLIWYKFNNNMVVTISITYTRKPNSAYLLGKLQSFGVSQHILELAYRGLIESILSSPPSWLAGNRINYQILIMMH